MGHQASFTSSELRGVGEKEVRAKTRQVRETPSMQGSSANILPHMNVYMKKCCFIKLSDLWSLLATLTDLSAISLSFGLFSPSFPHFGGLFCFVKKLVL